MKKLFTIPPPKNTNPVEPEDLDHNPDYEADEDERLLDIQAANDLYEREEGV